MDLQLFSIEQMPTTVPLWDTILEDLGRPPAARIARVLGVGRATVYRWNAAGHAPKTALLALYWLTRWGRSAVNTQAVNDALMAVQLARSYREECNKLRALGPGELAWPAIESTAAEPRVRL
jgi:predicted DNA-binding transcriptional regulator AlpA